MSPSVSFVFAALYIDFRSFSRRSLLAYLCYCMFLGRSACALGAAKDWHVTSYAERFTVLFPADDRSLSELASLGVYVPSLFLATRMGEFYTAI